MEIGRGNSKLRRMNRRFFLAARQRVQAPSALAPQRQFKIQNSKFMTSNLQSTFFDRGLFGFLKVLLRGAGQVMFQGNSWTGLFFIAGIFWGACMSDNCNVAWGALLGLMVSTATGYLLSLPEKDGHEGLWGFNGILVGCAFPTFMGNTLWMWIALAFCAAMTTWVRSALNNMMRTYKVNSFTFPFVLSTWIFLLAAHLMPALDLSNISAPELPSHITSGGYLYFHDLVQYILRGISQVFLIDSWVTGMLFLIGLALSSSWAALWAIVGSALSDVSHVVQTIGSAVISAATNKALGANMAPVNEASKNADYLRLRHTKLICNIFKRNIPFI